METGLNYDTTGPAPKWLRAKEFARLSGITEDAIKKKRHNGIWREGVEWIAAPDGNIMIDWRAVDRWVESQSHSRLKHSNTLSPRQRSGMSN